MKLSNRENDLLQALTGTLKSALSTIPGLGEAISGWDSYQKSIFERNLLKVISHLQNKVENIETFFSDEWIKTEDGKQYSRKVFDCTFDSQLEDKQELFVNVLINGVKDKQISYLEKLKYVDMLRHLSRVSLMVLAEMHKIFISDVRGPNRHPHSNSSLPYIDSQKIAEKLSSLFHPYIITSTINEMESQGLFSSTGEWIKKDSNGNYMSGRGFASGLCYTDFTARFVEFITLSEQVKGIK